MITDRDIHEVATMVFGAGLIASAGIALYAVIAHWRANRAEKRAEETQRAHDNRHERKYGSTPPPPKMAAPKLVLPPDATATEMRAALGHRTPPHTGGDA